MNGRNLTLEQTCAQNWDLPGVMLQAIENPRVPFRAPLSKIVGETVERHVGPAGTILEIGAGSGFLKELLPPAHRDRLVSSEYHAGNLRAGMSRRSLAAVACSAYELPIQDEAVVCVTNLDAFDTFPNLDLAFEEVERVLKPGGKFIHFQVNNPSDDMLDHDFPNMVWLPADPTAPIKSVPGVDRSELSAALYNADLPEVHRKVMEQFMQNGAGFRLEAEDHPEAGALVDLINTIVAEPGLGQTLIPSVYEYFKDRLRLSATKAGLSVVEATHRKESLPVHDEEYGSGQLVFGKEWVQPSSSLGSSKKVQRSASMMVFVAQKPSE